METLDLSTIASHLKNSIQFFFEQQDFSFYLPGREALIEQMPIDLRMFLLSVGKSYPYKVFYRITSKNIEIHLIRHPHQKSLK